MDEELDEASGSRRDGMSGAGAASERGEGLEESGEEAGDVGANGGSNVDRSAMEDFLAQMLSQSGELTKDFFRENGMTFEGDEPAPQERPLTPAEAQLVAERVALQAVLDDVRACSGDGRLSTPTHWAELGLAPEHMDDDAFTAFFFDMMEPSQKGEPFEGSGLPVDEGVYGSPEEDAPTDAGDGEVRGPVGAASAAAEGDAGAGEPASDAGDSAADVSAPVDDADACEPANVGTPARADVPSPDGLAGDRASAEGEDGSEPASSSEEGDAAQPAELVEPAVLEHVHDPLDYHDVKVLRGKSETYLYAGDVMSDNYAHWTFLSDEGDDLLTLADNARQESRLYPRPMLAASLTHPPYRWTLDHVYGVFRQMQESGEYPDIQECSATNGDVYYYSTQYLSTPQAKALAQWYSVEKPMNV